MIVHDFKISHVVPPFNQSKEKGNNINCFPRKCSVKGSQFVLMILSLIEIILARMINRGMKL